MSDERLAAYANWLRANKDKQGTPDFVKVADAYRTLRQPQLDAQTAPQPGFLSRLGGMAERAAANVVTGPYDMAASGVNGIANVAGKLGMADDGTRLPYAGPALRAKLGIPEQPANASLPERVLETAANVALQRRLPGASEYKGVLPELGHVARTTAGIEGGGELGQLVGGDTGRMVGSVLGGGGANIAANLATRPLSALGGENAGEVYDAAQRIGVRPTAGEVGNQGVKTVEKAFGAYPLIGAFIDRARNQSAEGLQGVRDRAAGAINEGSPPINEAHGPGFAFLEAARQGNGRISNQLSGEQNALEDAIGSNAATDVRPTVDALRSLGSTTTDSRTSPMAARAQELLNMATGGPTSRFPSPFTPAASPTDALNNVRPVPMGPAGPEGAVPYGVVKDVRTDLGRELNGMEGIDAHQAAPIYSALTQAMRDTADSRGQGAAFDAANARYAQMHPIAEQLGNIAASGESGAESALKGALHNSRAALDPKFNPNGATNADMVDALRPNEWNPVAASLVSRLGDQGTAFRPDLLARDWGMPGRSSGYSPEAQAMLTRSHPQSFSDLHDAATVGNEYAMPVARDGLSNAIGGLTAVKALTGGLTAAGGLPALAALPFAVGGLESGPVVRGIAGRATPLPQLAQENAPGLRASILNGLYGGGQ